MMAEWRISGRASGGTSAKSSAASIEERFESLADRGLSLLLGGGCFALVTVLDGLVHLRLDRDPLAFERDHHDRLDDEHDVFAARVMRTDLGTLVRVERARDTGVANLRLHLRDVLADGFGLPGSSRDAVMLLNILHAEQPVKLLTRAAHLLRPGGLVQIIHWRYDPATPRGPSLDIRPRPGQIRAWANKTGLLDCTAQAIDLPPWHYGLVARAG